MIPVFLSILIVIVFQCLYSQNLGDENCNLLDCKKIKCFPYYVVWDELKRVMFFDSEVISEDAFKGNLSCAFPEKVFEQTGIVLEVWNESLEEYFELNKNSFINSNSKINVKEVPQKAVTQGGLYSNPNTTYPKNITAIKTEEDLRNELLKNYNKNVWPWKEMNSTSFVQTNIMFHKIIDVDLSHGSLSMLVWFRLRWNDPRFTWDPEDWNGIKVVHLNQEEFWDPDIEIWNSLESIEKSLQPQFAYIGHEGDVFWSRMGQIQISCDMKGLDEFPYDTSHCMFEVGSWAYDSSKVMMGFYGQGYQLNQINSDDPFAQYNIKTVTPKFYSYEPFSTYSQDTSPWPAIQYNVVLHRNHAQYTYGIILPQALITLISFAAFWLPPSSGERISFTITIPLAIAVYKLLMYQQLPASNELVFATKFSFGCFLFTTFVVIESVFVSMLWWRTDPYFTAIWKSFKKLNMDMKEMIQWVDVIKAIDIEMTHQKVQLNSRRDLSSSITGSVRRMSSKHQQGQNNITLAAQNLGSWQPRFIRLGSNHNSSTSQINSNESTQNITFPLQNVEQAQIFLYQILDNNEYALKSYIRLCEMYSEQVVQNDLFRLMGVIDGTDSDFAQSAKMKYNQKWQKLSNFVDRICQFTVIPSFFVFVFIITFQVLD